MKENKFNSGVYEIRNLINNKRYIGSGVNLKSRKRQHFSDLKLNKHKNKHLQNTYNKYGKDAFNFRILLMCSNEDCIFYEQKCIDKLKPEYNICTMAGSSLGVTRSEETKEKIRIASAKSMIGNKRAVGSTGHVGLKRSPETRERIRQSKLGNKYSVGKVKSAETKAKISAAKKNPPQEIRDRMRAAAIASRVRDKELGIIRPPPPSGKGRKKTEEEKAKISASLMGTPSVAGNARQDLCVK